LGWNAEALAECEKALSLSTDPALKAKIQEMISKLATA
jgi:hypothetical protein